MSCCWRRRTWLILLLFAAATGLSSANPSGSGSGHRIKCYKCLSTSNGTGNYPLKGPDCLDPFAKQKHFKDAMVRCSKEAVGCLKSYRFVDGVEYVKRLCTFSRPKSNDHCEEWSLENARGLDCYCHSDGCNQAGHSSSIHWPLLLTMAGWSISSTNT